MTPSTLDTFAVGHHGLVTRRALEQSGRSRAAWYRALARGDYELLHPGVARVIGTAPSREQAIAAAVLAAGPDAMASHRSAARVWGVPRPPDDVVDIILPGRSRHLDLAGVVVHRPRDQGDLRPVVRAGIRTCNILRMLCDLGAVDPSAVHGAVGHVVTNALASPQALWSATVAHGRNGRPGVPALREALDDWTCDGQLFDSDLERRMRRLVRQHHLPAVDFHPIVEGYEVDFRVVGTPVLLECDGWEFHDKRRDRFERDRRRDAELVAAGYVVIRFTYMMLTRQPQWVATQIRSAVRRWAPSLAR